MSRTIAALVVLMFAAPAMAQGSEAALRFYGTGVGPPGQQDRVRITIDDDAPGPDASAPCDVGAGGFTIELWVRGTLADNSTANDGGDNETFDIRWIDGNIIVDRDIFGGSDRKWGISISGGFIRFGTSRGDDGVDQLDSTIEGNVNVLDGQWHHIACVRDAATGRKHLYIDGVLDYTGLPDISTTDISFPNDGAPGAITQWGPYIVLAAEKHDAGASFPSFNGYMDEVRIWNVARTQAEIAGDYQDVIAANTPGLVAYYRFEEGAGMSVGDASTAGSPDGELIAGAPGNGEWVLAVDDPFNTAPVGPVNEAPVVVASADVTSGDAPLTVQFSSAGTIDPDGGPQPLTYLWDFGDGSSSTDPNPTNVYVQNDLYTATLAVSDGLSETTSAPITIAVGTPATLTLDSIPAGIALLVDGQPFVTPAALATVVGADHTVEAPESATLGGTPYGFQCWSDGGARVHDVVLPAGGLALNAEFTPGGEVLAAVPADVRNADYYPPVGQATANLFDAFGLCCGRDGTGPYEIGLSFALAVPPGATILSATIEVTASNDQQGSPVADVRAYDVGDAPAFAPGSNVALTDFAALTDASVTWIFPPFAPGVAYETPDLAVVVQEVVDRGDWADGNFIGFVLDPTSPGDQWRCVRNFASGTPPTLTVTYTMTIVDGCGQPCAADCAAAGNGTVDIGDLLALLSEWGGAGQCDIAGADGTVNIADLLTLLAAWGSCV